MMDLIELTRKELLRRNYSRKTISTYTQCLRQFMRFVKEPRKITKADIKEYLNRLVEKGKSGSTLNVHLNAIKFATEEILNKSWVCGIKFARKPKRLPVVLTKEEVKRLIDSACNEHHRLMIKLMYSAGLRVDELVRLKREDLDLEQDIGWVRQGKGRKDRMFIIAEAVKEDLKSIEGYILKGRNGHLHVRSVQEVVRNAAIRAGIKKKVHPHTLRHSFATHMIENGYRIETVQALLGHRNPNTTKVYLHVTNKELRNVKSPLD